jgi:hypothetical protein
MMLWKNRNRRVGLCVTVVAGCLTLVILWAVLAMPETALAKKPVKPPGGGGGGEVGQEIPVGIAFDETGCIRSDQQDEHGDVPYVDGEQKGKVTAVVGRNFNIQLDTNNINKRTAGRTVWLDLSNALGCDASVKVDVSEGAGGDPDGICDDCIDSVPDLPAERFGTLPSGQQYGYPDSAELYIRGRDLDGLRVGNTVDTSAQMNFSVGGQSWRLYWGSFEVHGGQTYAPGTSPVVVKRLDNDTWQITCAGDACLYRENNPPHRATEYHGQVVVPFGFTAVAITHEETVWGDEPHGIDPGDDPCVL